MRSPLIPFRRAIAILVMVGTAGVPQLLNAAAPASSTPPTSQARSAQPNAQQQRTALDAMKADALRNLDSPIASVVRRAKRSLRMYDIATAPRAEKHKLIRQLPVKVTRTAAGDGRDGDILSFVANGRVRLEVFQPNAPIPLAEGEAVEECLEGEPPCATWQEHEDMLIVLADDIYQLELLEAEHEAEYAAYLTFCDQNPWACSTSAAVPDSASGMEPCHAKAWNAVEKIGQGLVAAAGLEVGVASAVSVGIKLSWGFMAASYVGVALLGGVAGYAAAVAVGCYLNPQEVASYMKVFDMPFEPSRGFSM